MATRRPAAEPSDAQIAHALMGAARDFILSDPEFSKQWLSKHPQFFRGVISAVKADGSAARVIRAGQTVADPIYYPIYASMYVPVKGHDCLLAWTGPKQAVILAIRGAGEPNTQRLASAGAAHVKKDSRGVVQSQHTDAGHTVQLRKDGKRVAHQQTEDGQHQIIGQQWIAMPGGKINLGAPLSGGYHVKGHDAPSNSYQHKQKSAPNKSEKLVRQHSPAKHILATKKASGTTTNPSTAQPFQWVWQADNMTHPDGHQWGDDGSGSDATAGATPLPTIADPTEGPGLSANAGDGSSGLPAGSYSCGYTLTTASGETPLSPLTTVSVDAQGSLTFGAIALPAPASNIFYYVSTQPDGTTLNKTGVTTGGAFTVGALPTSGITPPTTNTTQLVADPTVAPTLGQSTVAGGSSLSSNAGAGFGLLLSLGGSVAGPVSTLLPGTYSLGYAWVTPTGTSRISPLSTIKITATGQQIDVSGVPALPSGVSAVRYYMTPLQGGGQMSALRLLAEAPSTAAVSFAQGPTSAGSWPNANGTGVATPTTAPVITANAAATPTGLPAGTASLCFAWTDGSGHTTAASSTGTITLSAGGSVAFGPEDVPQNASGVNVYMSALSGGAYSGSMYLLQSSAVTAGGTFSATYTSAASSGAAAPPTISTMPTVNLGQLAEKHGPSGHYVKKYDGKNQTLYSNGQLHKKLCAAKNTFHYDTTGKVTHVAAASGDKHHIGDHIHGHASNGGTGGLSESGCALSSTGPYIRHSRESCDNAHSTYVHDGASEKLIKTHGPTKGHTIHSADGKVQHHHAVTTKGSTPAGSKHHKGDHVHSVQGDIVLTCDGTVTLNGAYFRKMMDTACADLPHVHTVNKGDGAGERKLATHGVAKGHIVHDGTVAGAIAHHHDAAGHKRHKGDHIHSVQGSIGVDCLGAVTLAGAYFRKWMDTACDNAHTHSHNHGDGLGERVLSAHGPTKGHTIHDGSPGTGSVKHHHHPSGNNHHTADHVHNADGGVTVNCDGTYVLLGNFQRKTVESDGSGGVQYAHYHKTQRLRSHHPTNGHVLYARDGATVLHHHDNVFGHHRGKGDHYRNVATLSASGVAGGLYHRRTHNSGLGRDEAYYSDGSNPEVLLRHHKSGEHGYYAVATGVAQLMVEHAVSGGTYGGKTRHSDGAGNFHAHGEDGTGKFFAAHGSTGNRVLDHDGSTFQGYATGFAALVHGGSYHAVRLTSGVDHVRHEQVTGGTSIGAKVRAKTSDAGTYFHEFGDNGASAVQILHGSSGNKALDHNGTQFTAYAGGGTDKRAIIHDGTAQQTIIGGFAVVKQAYAAVFGGQSLHKVNNASSYHVVGDDGTGYLMAQSQNALHSIKVSAGASAHVHDANGHTHPSSAKENAPSTDSSRVNVLSGSGNGALKQNSHSTTVITNVAGPYTIPTAGGQIANLGGVAPSGGSSTNANPFFKIQSAVVYLNGQANPVNDSTIQYVHAAPNASVTNNQYGVSAYNGGVPDSNNYWSALWAAADGGLLLYGKCLATAGSWNVATRIIIVNP